MFGHFATTEVETRSVATLEAAALGVAYAGSVVENVAMDLVDGLVLLPQSPTFLPVYAFIFQVEMVRDSLLAVEEALVAALPPLVA